MANFNKAENDFLFFSNPFEADQQVSQSSPQQIFSMVKSGSFGLYREQIISTFKLAGGAAACSNLSAVVKLCLDVVAESCKNGKAGLKLWFNPFTGRLELEAANGMRDSLPLWSAPAAAY